jgi:hypothetical protein
MYKRQRSSIVCCLVTGLLLTACASAKPTVATYQPTNALTPTARACVLGMRGTRLAIEDHGDSTEITFTADKNVDELQRRVHDQAAGFGPGAHSGLGHGGTHGGAHVHGLRLSWLPPTRVTVEDLDLGARISIAAVDPAQRDEVRAGVHERAARMASGDCP